MDNNNISVTTAAESKMTVSMEATAATTTAAATTTTPTTVTTLVSFENVSLPFDVSPVQCALQPELCPSGISLFRKVAILYGVILILLIITLNIPIFISFLHQNRNYIRPSSLFKLSIGTSDIVAACAYLPLLILVLQRGENTLCDNICAALVTVEKGQVTSSVWGIALISFDRYMCICKWDSYAEGLSLRRAYFLVTGVWVLACAIGAVSFFLSTSSRHVTGECICHLSSANYGFFNMGFSAFFIACCFIIPSIITALFNTLTALCLCRHSYHYRNTRIKYQSMVKPPSRSADDITASGEIPINIQKRRKVSCEERDDQVNIKLIVFLLTVYLVMVAPYFAVIVVVSMGHWSVHSHPYYLHIISALLFHTNSACNVLFYGYSNKRLRATIVSCLMHKLGLNQRDYSSSPMSRSAHRRRQSGELLSLLRDTLCRRRASSSVVRRAPSVRSEISILSACSRHEEAPLDGATADVHEGSAIMAATSGTDYNGRERLVEERC